MKRLLNDLLVKTETPNSANLLQSHACSQRVRACSACSCSNSSLFPYGSQECRHVAPYPSGRRWNRPQRSGVSERERAGFLPHPSLFMQGLSPHPSPDLHTSYPIWLSLWTALHHQPTIVKGSENAPEEISSRQFSFMIRLTSRHYRKETDSCSSTFLPCPFLPLLVKYAQPFSSKVIGSIKPGDLSQS